MALQDGTQLGNISMALQNLGAGIQGTLPQLQASRNQTQELQQRQQMMQQAQAQQQQQAQQQAAIERQKTVFTDANAALSLLEAGNLDGVVGLGMQRLQLLQQFPGADPSDTQRLTRLAIAAKNGSEEAKTLLRDELKTTVDIGRELGVIEKPQERILSDSEVTDEGQVRVLTPEGRLEARDIAGIRPSGGNDLARKFVQQIMPDGSFRTLQHDQRGNFFNASGRPVQLEPDANLVEGTMMQGTPEQFNTTSSEFSKLRDKEVATRSVIATVGDMLGMLQENPSINTIVSSAAGLANNLAAEARALGNAVGMGDDVDRLINPETFSSDFNELGIRNAQMQSLVTNLAYTVARANEPGGRLSDTDVRRAVKEIGGSASDPVAFARVLNDVARRAERNFQIDYRTRTGGDYQGGLGADQLPEFSAGEPEESPQIARPMSEEEYNALPSGAIFIDPDSGEQLRKP